MLFASPLYHEAIDFRSEAEVLGQVLEEAGSNVRLRVGAATSGSLTKLFALARSRCGLVLHLSAHAVKDEKRGVGLVLEDRTGLPHVLWRRELEAFLSNSGGLKHISLLVLSACYSEELAQVFIEHGCQHVLATREKVHDSTARRFSQYFYYELAIGSNLLRSWESAMQALLIDPDTTTSRECMHFTFYGQHGADKSFLGTLCGQAMQQGECNLHAPGVGLQLHFVDVATFVHLGLPTQRECFIGRPQLLHGLAGIFHGPKGRRVMVIHGPTGIGKSTFGVEFAHFVTTPGRLFACSPLLVKLSSTNLDDAVAALEEQLDTLSAKLAAASADAGHRYGSTGFAPTLSLGQRSMARTSTTGSSVCSKDFRPGCLTRSDSLASSRSDHSTLSFDIPEGEDMLSVQAAARSRIMRSLQQLQRVHRLTKVLIIIDDEAGYMGNSADFRWLLGDLLDQVNHLHFLVLSAQPVYEPLGATKVVNQPIGGLNELDSARLFLNRIHRPLGPADLPACSASDAAGFSSVVDRTCWLLRNHPLMNKLAGHPGHINSVAARVTPGGPSLYELAKMEDLLDDMDGAAGRALLRRHRSLPGEQRPPPLETPIRPFSASPIPVQSYEAVDLR